MVKLGDLDRMKGNERLMGRHCVGMGLAAANRGTT